jgi:ATP-dependent RNA circularization protein (DNA/RNA ligase family)
MKTIKKGMLIKNNKGVYSEVKYSSEKKDIVSLKDGSRYSYQYALSLQK